MKKPKSVSPPPEAVRSPGVPDPDDVKDALRNDHRELFDNNPILKQALDRIPHAWEVLGIQESLRTLAEPLDADTPFEPAEVQTLFDRLEAEGFRKDLYTLEATGKAVLMRVRTRQVERYIRYLEEEFGMDFQFNRKKLLVRCAPDGGSPRTLYSLLVEALRDEVTKESPGIENIEINKRIGPLLEPFFGQKRGESTPKGLLDQMGYSTD